MNIVECFSSEGPKGSKSMTWNQPFVGTGITSSDRAMHTSSETKGKEFAPFGDNNRSLLRWQPGSTCHQDERWQQGEERRGWGT